MVLYAYIGISLLIAVVFALAYKVDPEWAELFDETWHDSPAMTILWLSLQWPVWIADLAKGPGDGA